jgi:hypothetical protein
MTHVKPTVEELEADALKKLEEAEKLASQPPTEEHPVTPPVEPNIENPVTPPVTQPTTPEPSVTPPVNKEQDDIDYKKKFIESSREAQVQYAQNKGLINVIDQAKTITDIPEEELKKEYSEWDEMSDLEKKFAKDNLINKKRFESIEKMAEERKDIEKWNEKVDTYVDDPNVLVNHPELEGKITDFKIFCTKPTRRGVDLGDLVLAFMGESVTKVKPKNNTIMMPTGSGGENDKLKPKSDKVTPAQADAIRATDYKKYKELVENDKIDYSAI